MATASAAVKASAKELRHPKQLDSYEGTYQMQNLIVGKAVTGLSAFV